MGRLTNIDTPQLQGLLDDVKDAQNGSTLAERFGDNDSKLSNIAKWYNYTNLITNSNFSSGTTGWTALAGTIASGTGCAISTGNGTAASVGIEKAISISNSLNKIYILSVTYDVVTNPTSPTYSFDMIVWGTGGTGYTIQNLKTSGIANTNKYVLYKAVTESQLTSINKISARHTYTSADNSNGAVVNISNVMLIEGEAEDLTLTPFELSSKYPYTASTNSNYTLVAGKNFLDIRDFGIVGDGVTDDSAKLQSAISSLLSTGGDIFLPARTYLINSDVKIVSPSKQLRVIGYGAKFIGTGKLILDSCIRVALEGINAKAIKMCLRGVWWSNFTNIDVGQFVVGDVAGSLFSDNYWNNFQGLGTGQILFDVNRGHFNANNFYASYIRSDVNHGFLTQYDYNIKINSANKLVQNNTFNGCDLSYASTSPIYIDSGNTKVDTVIKFDQCYFDTSMPNLEQNAIIILNECLSTGNYITNASTSTASKVEISATDTLRFTGWTPTSTHNFFKDGTFITGVSQSNIIKDSATTLTYSKTGGVINGYVDVNQPNSALSYTYFVAGSVPLTGYYSNVIYLKNNAVGSKTIKVVMAGNYFDVVIKDTEWTRIGLCGNSVVNSGSNVEIMFYTADNSPYNVRVGCVGVMFGKKSQLLPVPDYKLYLDKLVSLNSLIGV